MPKEKLTVRLDGKHARMEGEMNEIISIASNIARRPKIAIFFQSRIVSVSGRMTRAYCYGKLIVDPM